MKTLPDAMTKWRTCYAECLKSQSCTPGICASQCEGQVVAAGYSLSQASEIMRYNVLGVYGASCIGDLRSYIDKLRTAALTAHRQGVSLGSQLAITIVDQILDAVISQLLNQLTSQICNVTSEVMQSANSFLQNAICLPSFQIKPFDFHLNIQNLTCDGFSVNPLTGQINGSPISGVSTPSNIYSTTPGATYTAPTTTTTTPIYNYDQTTLPTDGTTSVGVQ